MSWDGIKRRSEDDGTENPGIILGRIDERVKSSLDKLDAHIKHFEIHVEDDKKNFSGLYKTAYIGSGIIMTIQFIILVLKH